MSSLLFKLLVGKGAISEAIETFRLNLSNPSGGATLAKSFGTATIQQNPILPAFTTNRTSVSNTGVAPLYVHFDASTTTAVGLTSIPFHELYFYWTFGDSASGATWGYGTNAGAALKNEASGPIAAHVFETAGSYTVTLTAYHLSSGGSLTISAPVTKTITVTAADTVFAGNNTVCISKVGDFVGAPAGALQVTDSVWANVKNYTLAGKRVLLRAGEQWVAPNLLDACVISNAGPGILGKFGTGAAPNIYTDQPFSPLKLQSASDWRIIDINISGDKSIQTNQTRSAFNLVSNNNVLLLRYETSGTAYGINAIDNVNMAVVDSYIHDSEDVTIGPIGIWAERSFGIAMLGCKVERITQNHSARFQGATKGIFAHNTMIAARPTAHLLTIRGMQNNADYTIWNGIWAEDLVVSDNLLDGSSGCIDVLKIGPQNTSTGERIRNAIVERNYVVSKDKACINVEVTGGQTVRNNICSVSNWYCAISISGASSTADMTPPPTASYVYNNTMYQPASGGFTGGFSGVLLNGDNVYSWPQGTILKNNIAYAPGANKNGNSNGTGPTLYEVVTVGCPAPTLLTNSSNTQVKSNLPFVSATPTTAADYAPADYAVATGSVVPVRDNYNAAAVGTRNLGAI